MWLRITGDPAEERAGFAGPADGQPYPGSGPGDVEQAASLLQDCRKAGAVTAGLYNVPYAGPTYRPSALSTASLGSL